MEWSLRRSIWLFRRWIGCVRKWGLKRRNKWNRGDEGERSSLWLWYLLLRIFIFTGVCPTFSDVNGLQRLLEDVLSIAVTEAICKRYFRICLMIRKRVYVTNLSERTVHRMSFIRYYKVEICNLIKKENMLNELRE